MLQTTARIVVTVAVHQCRCVSMGTAKEIVNYGLATNVDFSTKTWKKTWFSVIFMEKSWKFEARVK